MLKLPSLHNLHVFSVAAQHQSFRRAAAALFVTPGAVSRQVRALEHELSVQLFQRIHQRVVLTDAGVQLHAQLQHAFQLISTATAQLKAKPAASKSGVTVSILPSVYQHFLAARLPQFRLLHPHIELTLIPAMAVQDLAAKQLDFGIRNGNGNWPGMVIEPLQPEHLIPVIASGLYQQNEHDLWQSIPLLNPYDDWKKWFLQAGIVREVLTDATSYPDKIALLQAVHTGKGIALLPELLCRDLCNSGELTRLRGPILTGHKSYYLVYPQQNSLSADAILCRDWIIATFRTPLPTSSLG